MDTGLSIKPSIEYIKHNLKTTITAEELSSMSGYSLWHFQRLFKNETGVPVAVYINKRRLDAALSEIRAGRRAIDAALDYGFDTYAGFYKAFIRMYGDSPKRYLTKKEGLIMYTEKDLRRILTNWDIPQDLHILDIYVMDGALLSGNVWSIGEDYFLKIENRDSLLKNISIAKALSAQGFGAATPVLTRTGEEYIDGEKTAVLTRGIKGSPLTKDDRFGDDRYEFGVKYGRSIARLHNALEAIESELKPDEQDLYTQVIEWALPESKRINVQYGLGIPDSFFEDYIINFGAISDKMPRQLIHRDPNPSNILFDAGEVSGFIDFDLSHRNYRLFDPCYCATGLLSEWRGVLEEARHEKWQDILAGILHGYDKINPLLPEEKQAVYYVICSIQMIFMAYCESKNELKEMAKTNREMTQYLFGCKDWISKIF